MNATSCDVLVTRSPCNKNENINFQFIMKLPCLSSKIPSLVAYGVFISFFVMQGHVPLIEKVIEEAQQGDLIKQDDLLDYIHIQRLLKPIRYITKLYTNVPIWGGVVNFWGFNGRFIADVVCWHQTLIYSRYLVPSNFRFFFFVLQIEITRKMIRYRATANLRRPQIKQYTASN